MCQSYTKHDCLSGWKKHFIIHNQISSSVSHIYKYDCISSHTFDIAQASL